MKVYQDTTLPKKTHLTSGQLKIITLSSMGINHTSQVVRLFQKAHLQGKSWRRGTVLAVGATISPQNY